MWYKIGQLVNTLSKTERTVLLGAALIFLVASFFIVANTFADITEEIPVPGGTYREGVVGQPSFINPVTSGNSIDRDISRLIFSSVTDLAESVKVDEEGRTWTVRIKDNAIWSDGERLTSDDLIFTVQKIQDPESYSPIVASWQGVVTERVSELELKFITRTPYAFFEDNLSNLQVIPEHIFENIPSANIRLSNYGLEPVGSGPYRYDPEYKKRSDGFITEYSLVANETYFGEAPFVQKITFKFYPGEEELVEAFNRGVIDGFGTSDPGLIPLIKLRRQLIEMSVPRYFSIFINPTIAPEELDDRAVRAALSGTIDRSKLVAEIFDNRASVVYGPLLSTGPAETEFDPFLLEGLELELVVPEREPLVESANLIEQMWERHGAKVSVIVLPLSQIQNEIIKTRNYELLLFGNILGENKDLFSFWHSSERSYPGLNLALYQDSDADELMEAIRKDFNKESRDERLQILNDIIAGDIPALFLYSPNYLYITSPKLKGLTAHTLTTPDERFEDVESWYLKTAYRFKTKAN